MSAGLPFHLEDYIKLVDWSGQIIREGKRGSIHNELPPIIDRLDIEPKTWLQHSKANLKALQEEKTRSIIRRRYWGFK